MGIWEYARLRVCNGPLRLLNIFHLIDKKQDLYLNSRYLAKLMLIIIKIYLNNYRNKKNTESSLTSQISFPAPTYIHAPLLQATLFIPLPPIYSEKKLRACLQ